MKKSILLFSLFVLSICLKSQSFYYEVESSIDGMSGMMAKMSKTKMTVYIKGNKTKTVFESMGYTETTIADDERVVITTSNPKRCVIITKNDLLKDSLDGAEGVEVVSIEATNDSRVLNGYKCQKTDLSYQIKDVKDKALISCWITKDVPFYKPTKKPLRYRKIRSADVATEKLEGFTMLTVAKTYFPTLGEITTNFEVTKTSTLEINDSEFIPDAKLCKNPMNLEEYKNALQKDRENQAINNHSMNSQNSYYFPKGF